MSEFYGDASSDNEECNQEFKEEYNKYEQEGNISTIIINKQNLKYKYEMLLLQLNDELFFLQKEEEKRKKTHPNNPTNNITSNTSFSSNINPNTSNIKVSSITN